MAPALAPAQAGRVPLSVYLIDDHAAYRRCVRDALAGTAQVAGEAADGHAALAAAAICAPRPLVDVVLLDIALPGLHGVEVARRLLVLAPGTRLVVLSSHHEPVLVQAMFDTGARAFVGKHEPLPVLVAAIQRAAV